MKSELEAGLFSSGFGLGSIGDLIGSEADLGGSDEGLGGRSGMNPSSEEELVGGCHSLLEALRGNSSLLAFILGEPDDGCTA